MSDYPQIEEERQVEILDRFYTGEEVIKDVISGLKFQKKKKESFWNECTSENSMKLLFCIITDVKIWFQVLLV